MIQGPVTEVTRPRLPRTQVEIGSLTRLASATARAMAWPMSCAGDSLSRGDTRGFAAQATISGKLPTAPRVIGRHAELAALVTRDSMIGVALL